MVAGCGAKLSKMILFIFNFLVWLVGIILIGLGAYVLANPGDYSSFFGSGTNSLKVVCGAVIGVGCLVFLLAFAGCCGAIKESACLLKTYIAVLVLLLILEIVGGILAFVFRGKIEEVIKKGMKEEIATYVQPDDPIKSVLALDVLQLTGCCGADGYADWKDSAFRKLPANTGKVAPLSCCKKDFRTDDTCNDHKAGNPDDPLDTDKMNTAGCINYAIEGFKNNFLIIGAVAISMIVAEILAMIFACCVISGINSGDYE